MSPLYVLHCIFSWCASFARAWVQARAVAKQGDAKSRPCTQEKHDQPLTLIEAGALGTAPAGAPASASAARANCAVATPGAAPAAASAGSGLAATLATERQGRSPGARSGVVCSDGAGAVGAGPRQPEISNAPAHSARSFAFTTRCSRACQGCASDRIGIARLRRQPAFLICKARQSRRCLPTRDGCCCPSSCSRRVDRGPFSTSHRPNSPCPSS